MIGNLPGRIVATMGAICVFAVALTATLNFYKYDSTLAELLRSRFTFLLRDMRNTLETGMNLGLPLKGLDNVPELISGNAARNPEILSIEVFDPSGTVLFSTDSSFVGDLVAETWLDRWHKSPEPIWNVQEHDADTLGITLQNSLGQTAGSIALRYNRRLEDGLLYGMALRLAGVSLVVVASATALIGLGSYLLLRPMRHQLLAMQASTERLLKATPSSVVVGSEPDPTYADFVGTASKAAKALDDATAEIHRLDHNG